jgi:hypothetical protein
MRIAFLDSWLQDVPEGSGTAAAIGGLAGALIALAADPERRARLGSAARRRYEEGGRPAAAAAPLVAALRERAT